ncbi:MAG: A/G-specific adenine glycosylase [Verrucomicrobiota bacterium]
MSRTKKRQTKDNAQCAIRNSQLTKLVPLLLNWFSENARDLPWRRTRNPYAIWVSEIMLQQTQVKTVIPYWKRWMRELPTIKAVANASPDKIHKLWEGLGYYTRVRNLQKAARQIVEKHGGTFPKNFDDVLALPGIGRYTAGAICSVAFNQPVPVLDGNVIRVLTRIFGIGENPREKETNARLWQLAEELVGRAACSRFIGVLCPPRRGEDTAPYHSFLNQSLMELGALICTPRNAKCKICPAQKLCVAFRENRVAELPNLGRRTTTTRRFIAFVIERNGKFLVRQRPAGIVNARLWEFPNVECVNGEADVKQIFKTIFSTKPAKIQPLCTIKHSITRYRITLEAFRVPLGGASSARPHNKIGRRGTPPSEIGVWLSLVKLDSLALASAHRKIMRRLQY